jgi:hypothetical protein
LEFHILIKDLKKNELTKELDAIHVFIKSLQDFVDNELKIESKTGVNFI